MMKLLFDTIMKLIPAEWEQQGHLFLHKMMVWWPGQNRQNLPLSKRWIKSPQTKTKREECNTGTSYRLEEDGSVLILWLFQPIALLSPLFEAGEVVISWWWRGKVREMRGKWREMAWKMAWDAGEMAWDGVENGVRWRGKWREMTGTTSWY